MDNWRPSDETDDQSYDLQRYERGVSLPRSRGQPRFTPCSQDRRTRVTSRHEEASQVSWWAGLHSSQNIIMISVVWLLNVLGVCKSTQDKCSTYKQIWVNKHQLQRTQQRGQEPDMHLKSKFPDALRLTFNFKLRLIRQGGGIDLQSGGFTSRVFHVYTPKRQTVKNNGSRSELGYLWGEGDARSAASSTGWKPSLNSEMGGSVLSRGSGMLGSCCSVEHLLACFQPPQL